MPNQLEVVSVIPSRGRVCHRRWIRRLSLNWAAETLLSQRRTVQHSKKKLHQPESCDIDEKASFQPGDLPRPAAFTEH